MMHVVQLWIYIGFNNNIVLCIKKQNKKILEKDLSNAS